MTTRTKLNPTQIRARIILFLAGILLLLTGCSTATTEQEGAVQEFSRVIDGRTVECIYVDGYKAGGLSCDWARP